MKTWGELGITVKTSGNVEQKTACPRCSPYRKKKHYPCLSVNLEKGVWLCFHCDWTGSLHTGEERPSNPSATPLIYRKPVYRQTTLPQRVLDWFASRGIPETVLARRRISYGPIYMPQLEQEVSAIQFPYFRDGECVNVKYRDGHKYFRMIGGAERLLYGWDDIAGDTLTICEGEMDALALEVAGVPSVVSVPDGAPALNAKNYERKFEYLLAAEALLTPLKKIVLAVDNDAPGQKLAEELARRLGPERCWRVTWASECKDANDVLIMHGGSVLRECIEEATPWPVRGIITVDMLSAAIDYIYDHGIERGMSPGWSSLAQYYTVRPGELTIVGGIPNAGKTPWVSAVCLHLAKTHGWRITFFSPESAPLERYSALMMGQYVGAPFDGPGRMEPDKKEQAKAWLGEHVTFLLPEDDAPTVDTLLALAKTEVYRHGIKGLVIDPWNEMEHTRPVAQTETEYIGHALTKLRRFARQHGVHVWIIAHPTKMRKAERGTFEGKYPPPTPYDLAGSANFRNKADNIICVWRDAEEGSKQVDIYVQKIRFREIGRVGQISLLFDPLTGRYREPSCEDQAWTA